MSSKLQIIVDISGSMYEMAKMSISMNLLSTVREFNDDNKIFDEITLFFWNDNINQLNFLEPNDFISFSASGKLNFSKLQEHLSTYSEDEIKVLLLSDGLYGMDEFNEFLDYINSNPNIFITPIAIGADAIFSKLEKISFNKKSYLAEDILTAFKSLKHNSNKKNSKPKTISNILNSVVEEEDIDEC